MQKTVTVNLEDRDIEVKKLPLGRYAEILAGITELPRAIGSFDKLEPDTLINSLPTIIATCFPDVLHILSIATNIDKKELSEELGLADGVKLLIAVLEVNNYSEIYQLLKKVLTKPAVQGEIVELQKLKETKVNG